jgi:hypothetical protein
LPQVHRSPNRTQGGTTWAMAHRICGTQSAPPAIRVDLVHGTRFRRLRPSRFKDGAHATD